MVAAAIHHPQKRRVRVNTPRYVFHPSFGDADAEILYGQAGGPKEDRVETERYMPDEVTRDCARRMHYAAYRMQRARAARERVRWQGHYFALRNRIILGNRKLIFRAVQKWKGAGYQADDLIGECDLVLIRVVAAYNPWRGIRFSTYAFTCLMRTLSRLWSKITAEREWHPRFLDQWADAQFLANQNPPAKDLWEPLEQFLRDGHALLSEREKMVLKRRYGLGNQCDKPTLEALGRDLGLSKERIRQLEKGAVAKLRRALSPPLSLALPG